MGMVWVARLASDSEVAAVRADPDSAYDFINPEEGWETAPIIDLDKEWHALHFLLTQSAGSTDSPLSIILGKFEEIGEDNGYGPAFLIPAEAWQTFCDAAAALDEAALTQRYNPKAMVDEHVYIADMYLEEGDDGLAFLTDRLNELREFAAKAAAGGLSALAVIT
ncbi:MAG: YfbM family protein [Erythrobacter sp.]|uniref:DUF1877 family protein n=1 Tax=Erythrobacter sp. TaxID=1042 RepID=UPI0025DB43E7|nr:DUF1877 family protein [Erythrobacter sp.]MCL9998877.1 YfbM family protein [Erythrobacter sp.]